MSLTIALVPARLGSQRVASKNTRLLCGVPLLAYSIAAAQESGCFDGVVVSAEGEEIARIARQYGAVAISQRTSTPLSTDIEWVTDAIRDLHLGPDDVFSILRPTSPFRTGDTIRRAFDTWHLLEGDDSLRAVEPVRQHPAKMWVVNEEQQIMRPLLTLQDWHAWDSPGPPLHSRPYQALPKVWAQNSSLEIAWVRTVLEQGTISGLKVAPFLTRGYEGLSIDVEDDFMLAEMLIETRRAELPSLWVAA